MCQKKKIKAVVCGVGFGQFYIEGLKLIDDEIELVGILSTGSERSRICAKHYGINIYTHIDEIKEDIDLACVVVKSEIMGGQGTNLAINFLSRGINVILEHPINHRNIAKCVKIARENNALFTIGDLYTRLPSVKQYLACAKKVLENQKLEYLEIQCSTRVLFPMVHILSKLLPSISRIEIKSVTKELGIYQIMLGTIDRIPFIFKANNEVNVNEPDGYIREFHKISINVPWGKLTLTDTHGPILWQPILTLPNLKNDPRDMFNEYPENLLQDSTMIIGQSKSSSYKEILSKHWPRAIADNILEMKDMILGKTKKSYNVDLQKIIIVSEKWKELSNKLGYPELSTNRIDKLYRMKP